MADPESTVRQRKPNEQEPSGASASATAAGADTKKPTTKSRAAARSRVADDEDAYSPWVDVLRVLTFLLLASCGISYLVTGGKSFVWGVKTPPKYLRVNYWKSRFTPLQHLTLEELSAYDGSDPTKPIYLAINGTIFDVSANPRMYGRGGSYNVFAGADASRGFVTGCFAEDRTADMRGVETMFLPREDPEDARFSAAELEALRVAEMEAARKKVRDALAHWVRFFENHAKYTKIGYVTFPAGWPESETPRALCQAAEEGRKKRTAPGEKKEA